MLRKGTRLNDTYIIEEEIGAGGGGVVYKAYHERLKTWVVVKQIREKVKGILESRAEADILKRIKHTYLPRVYDFLEADGEIYTVMDYVPGRSLDKVLKEEKKIAPGQVLKWAEQLAEAEAIEEAASTPKKRRKRISDSEQEDWDTKGDEELDIDVLLKDMEFADEEEETDGKAVESSESFEPESEHAGHGVREIEVRGPEAESEEEEAEADEEESNSLDSEDEDSEDEDSEEGEGKEAEDSKEE